jgi:hypothetical protein
MYPLKVRKHRFYCKTFWENYFYPLERKTVGLLRPNFLPFFCPPFLALSLSLFFSIQIHPTKQEEIKQVKKINGRCNLDKERKEMKTKFKLFSLLGL